MKFKHIGARLEPAWRMGAGLRAVVPGERLTNGWEFVSVRQFLTAPRKAHLSRLISIIYSSLRQKSSECG